MDVVGSQNWFGARHLWPIHKRIIIGVTGLLIKRAEQQHVWDFFFLSVLLKVHSPATVLFQFQETRFLLPVPHSLNCKFFHFSAPCVWEIC